MAAVVFFNKYYKIIILLIIMAVVIGGYLILLSGKVFQLKEQSSIMLEKMAEFEDLEQYNNQLKQLEDTIKEFQKSNAQQVAKLEEVLPGSPQIPQLLAQLEALVKSSSFNLSGLTLSEAALPEAASAKTKQPKEAESLAAEESKNQLFASLPDTVRVLKISLSVSGGDYFAFKDLLKDFETHIRLFDIISLSFSGGSSGGSGEYSLNLQTYYFVESL